MIVGTWVLHPIINGSQTRSLRSLATLARSLSAIGVRIRPALQPPARSPNPLAHPEGVCRFGQALRFVPLATPSATLRVTLRSLRYVPSLHSNRLGAGLRPSPTLFVGYRTENAHRVAE